MLRSLSGLKPVRLGPFGPFPPVAVAAAVLALAVLVAGAGIGLMLAVGVARPPAAKFLTGNAALVPLDQPVVVQFDKSVDLSHTRVDISPAAKVVLNRSATQLVIAPDPNWQPSIRYRVRLGGVPDAKHHAVLAGYQASFKTQYVVGVAGWTVDGQPAPNGRLMSTVHPAVTAVFTGPMREDTVQFTINGQFVPAHEVSWNQAQNQATVTTPTMLLPYRDATFAVAATGVDSHGDPMTSPGLLTLLPLALEPANTTSGIGSGFKATAPVMIVVENSAPARPQSGLQNADMVFEYLSEYGITRMTAVFFNNVAPVLRPVRSCRVMNLYLDFAFRGLHMCSGTSAGTYLWFMGNHHTPVAPGAINDVDPHGYFYRCGADAPHNLCVSAQDAERLRAAWPQPPPLYTIDPPHLDAQFGTPTPDPSVAQHCVSYRYDPGSQTYLRYDHGMPFIDAGTGQQLRVKNVVVMHVDEQFAGWVEDENGGAQSVWYLMIGSGPAEIWSDGRGIQGTWHMGDGLPDHKAYWLNNQAPYFTDSAGNLIELNSGLTWVHVVGNEGLNAGC